MSIEGKRADNYVCRKVVTTVDVLDTASDFVPR